MSSKAKNSDKLRCIISAVIIIGCYAAERFISLTATPSKTIYLVEAMLFSLAVAIVYFIVVKAENSFYGILPAILGLRMLPPELKGLADFSSAGHLVYYIVGKFAIVIFAFALLRLYLKQDKDNKISGIAILSLMLVVPFANGISGDLSAFIKGNFSVTMLYVYGVNFVCYIAALIFILFVGTRSNAKSAQLIADYTMVALCVNTARRVVIIAYSLANSTHISKSYFCWVAIYVFFIVAFYLLKKKKTAKA